VYCDVVFSGLQDVPAPGQEVYARSLSLHAGGGAAISASYFASLGVSTELCATLPAAPFEKIVMDELGSKIGMAGCTSDPQDDPQLTVVMTGEMDRSFVTRRVGSALPADYASQIEKIIETGRVCHMHIGELASLLDYPDLVSLARSANWTVSLDCAWDVDAMCAPEAAELVAAVDVFLPNNVEHEKLLQLGWAEQCAPITVVKRGEEGGTAFTDNDNVSVTATPVNVVDATGAGDAFNAGFISAWLERKSIEECLVAGNQCGADAVGHLGGCIGH
jgi:sugar/nucleoside kinase (ribokinase family)